MLVAFSEGVVPSLAVPASPLSSLRSAVPSARQNASMLSVSTRLHLGQRFIFCSGSPLGHPTYALDVPIGKFELTDIFRNLASARSGL